MVAGAGDERERPSRTMLGLGEVARKRHQHGETIAIVAGTVVPGIGVGVEDDYLVAPSGNHRDRVRRGQARFRFAAQRQLCAHAVGRTGGRGAIEQSSDQLEASVERLADARANLGELGRAFREVAASSRMMLDAYEARGRGDAELSAGLEQLGQHVMRFNERVRSFVRRVDEELARSSKLLSSAVHGPEENGS
jgi:hypothetical protein